MNYSEFAKKVREFAKQSGSSIREMFHDDEKGLHFAFVAGYRITANSISKKITAIDRHGKVLEVW